METKRERNPESNPAKVGEHVKGAHEILKALQEKIGAHHPEIATAITKLELALYDLEIETGGLL